MFVYIFEKCQLFVYNLDMGHMPFFFPVADEDENVLTLLAVDLKDLPGVLDPELAAFNRVNVQLSDA